MADEGTAIVNNTTDTKQGAASRLGFFYTRILKWVFFTLAIGLVLLSFENESGVRAEYLFMGTPVLVVFYALFLHANRKSSTPVRKRQTLEWLYWIAAIWLLPWAALRLFFGVFEIYAALFHLQAGFGSAADFTTVLAIIASTIIVLIAFHATLVLARKFPLPRLALLAAIVVVIAVNPLNKYMVEQQFRAAASDYLLPELVTPEVVGTPERLPNLVIIYLEGMERTYRQAEAFGPAYAPISRLEDEAVTFEQIGQLPLTEWTMAGMVAGQCGVPLVPRGFFQKNRANDGSVFMPGSTCLTDILRAQGYRLENLTGGDKDFGGLAAFVASHGNGAFTDYQQLDEVPGRAPDDWQWGVGDANMFDAALARIGALEAGDQPFSFILQTAGPHGPKGHIAAPCRRPGEAQVSNSILRPLECTAQLTEAFVRNLQNTVDMDNTLIVLMSDHFAHPFVNVADTLASYERRNTVMFIGAGATPRRITKPGTMIDVFPTILATMGFDMATDTAGFGVSLYAAQPGNFLRDDPETLARVFRQDIDLANALWRSE